MNLIILSIYFTLIILVGIYSYRKIKGSDDFFVAGRDAGFFGLTGSLLGTILGSSAILGSVSYGYKKGWAGSWFMLSAAIGLFILYFLLNKLTKFKGYNLPELLESFYGGGVKEISSLIIATAWTGAVASQIMGASMIITSLTDISYTSGILISGGVFIIYTIFGGQLSIMKTDFIQLLFILVGIVFTYTYMTGNYEIGDGLGFIGDHFTYLDLLVMFLTYSSTYFVGPDIYSRVFCARDEKTAKRSILTVGIILIPLGLIFAALGIYASTLYPNIDIGGSAPLLYLAKSALPKGLLLLLYLGLLSAVISSADTMLLTTGSLFTQVFTKELKSKRSLKLTRIAIVILGVVAILIALKAKFILDTILLAFGVYSGALIVPTLLGIIGYRVGKSYVIGAMVIGGGIALYGKVGGGIYSNYYIISSFIVNLIIMVIPRFYRKGK